MCATTNKRNTEGMTDKAKWIKGLAATSSVSDVIPSDIQLPKSGTTFPKIPKLACFSVPATHRSVSELKLKGSVVCIKCGYSSALIVAQLIDGVETKSEVATKKVFFQNDDVVKPMLTNIVARTIAPATPESAKADATAASSAPDGVTTK